MRNNFTISDTISLTINIGNETYPNLVSDLVNQSEVEPPDIDQSDEDQGWEHIRVALVAILAAIISFLTIVGNIMVTKSKHCKIINDEVCGTIESREL